MVRKISCKLWAYKKNNSNIRKMILYKIILFKEDLPQTAQPPSPAQHPPGRGWVAGLQPAGGAWSTCPTVTGVTAMMNNVSYYSGN